MIKAVIFDCFGVLAEDGWLPFKRKHIGDNDDVAQEISDLGKQNEYGMIDNASHRSQVIGILGVEGHVYDKAVGVQMPNHELFDYITKELKPKYKIGLLSNANYDVVDSLFSKQQSKLFDATALSYDTRLIKPDPRMYQLIADRLGVDANECLYVDDQERYCVGAENIGMQSIVYKNYQDFVLNFQKIS